MRETEDRPKGYFRFKRPEMAIFLPDKYKRVLEIGCGEGEFTGHLKPGSEVWGIEPDPKAAAVANGKMKRVLVGKYDKVFSDLPEKYFDLIIANDVIEHMDSHDVFFNSIKEKMIPGGYLVASIPNVRHWSILRELLWKKDWRYTDAGILDRTHLRIFTGKSLKRTLRDHGFILEKFKGINQMKFERNTWFPHFLRLITLGYYGDILFYQYGLCVRKP